MIDSGNHLTGNIYEITLLQHQLRVCNGLEFRLRKDFEFIFITMILIIIFIVVILQLLCFCPV